VGIAPLLLAFGLAEVLAVLVPGWRRRRHAGRAARQPITHAVIVLAVVFTLLHGWALALYLATLEDVLGFGLLPRVLVVGSLALGTALLAGLAAVLRRFGLGNGFGVLLASGWLVAGGRAAAGADAALARALVVGV